MQKRPLSELIVQIIFGKLRWSLIRSPKIITIIWPRILRRLPNTERFGHGYDSREQGRFRSAVARHRFLWADYLNKNTNVFQYDAIQPNLSKLLAQHPPERWNKGVNFTFNFSYAANTRVLLSNRLLPWIQETKHHALADFYPNKTTAIVALVDCVSFRDATAWGWDVWSDGAMVVVGESPWDLHLFSQSSSRILSSSYIFGELADGMLVGRTWLF